ncbi:MAG: FtsQ-type POTRA domain-containing protein [Acidobacteriaceae bacterium]|nr:FtsQ-type POTRA domain-containing protein [Acidobacteriaceae bacterium]MBV9779549.1 FtsQ-type POTRA domain-containing protein [Acidobacteriaceae bacterium]
MARRPEAEERTNRVHTAKESLFAGIRWGRFAIWLSLGFCLMMGTLYAWRRTEEFLIKDDRFRVTEADEFPGQSPNLIVEGIHYASASQIRHVFAEDFGRSLYLVPVERRREQLLAIDWVEEATVSKIWPNTIKAHVRERTPVAFVRLRANPKDGMSQLALIDKDGYLLRPRVAAKFILPVIRGVRETESLENRRARVRRVLGMLKEAGPLANQISEVNVADPNNLIAAEHVDNRVVNLMLGDENYAERLRNFLANYHDVMLSRPDAKTFDLRVDGVITALGEETRGE